MQKSMNCESDTLQGGDFPLRQFSRGSWCSWRKEGFIPALLFASGWEVNGHS